MMRRCYDEKASQFKYYGGRGIRVAIEWHSFECFLKDMGERPQGATLSRVDNDGNYEKGNCKWETDWREQVRNRSNTHWVEYLGDRMTLSDFAKLIGLCKNTLYNRVAQGWPTERIVNHYTQKGKWARG